MNKKIFIIIFLLVLNILYCNYSAFASESKIRVLRGNVTQNIKNNLPEMVIFVPESEIIELENFIQSEPISNDKIEVLRLSDISKPVDAKDRLNKASFFMFLGGMSVTGSIERSMRDGRAEGMLSDNFTSPVKSVKNGWKKDNNEFLINYVGHPLEWFLLANYLKAAGASDREAIFVSQLTNIAWEFVVEGCYISPSPKDLATNTLGSLAGIYLYNTALKKHMDLTYNKFAAIGEKHGIDLVPQIRYNSETKGMVFGALIKIKK